MKTEEHYKLDKTLESIKKVFPKGLLQEEPCFQLSDEVIPESLRGEKKGASNSDSH